MCVCTVCVHTVCVRTVCVCAACVLTACTCTVWVSLYVVFTADLQSLVVQEEQGLQDNILLVDVTLTIQILLPTPNTHTLTNTHTHSHTRTPSYPHALLHTHTPMQRCLSSLASRSVCCPPSLRAAQRKCSPSPLCAPWSTRIQRFVRCIG